MNVIRSHSSNARRRRYVALSALVMAASLLVVTGRAVESRAADQVCPSFGADTITGALSNNSINEASGLVASRVYKNRYWLHNDSGDSARIFVMKQNGVDRGTVKLGTRPSSDFEDIAIGPGPVPNKDYIYVADIGNNGKRRSSVRIYRIAEPEPPGKGKTITIPDSQIETFYFQYENPDNPGTFWNRNAEAFVVDPVTGDVMIIEKQLQTIDGVADMGWVYKIDKTALVEGETITAKAKTAIQQRRGTNSGPMTGADISPDGTLIVAKNGSQTFAWLRADGQSMFQALNANPITECLAPSSPGEAIAITRSGSAYVTVTEGRGAPVHKITVDYKGAPLPPPPPPPPPSGGLGCLGRAATIVGTEGDDVLIGTSGSDVIVGLGGNDVIKGKKGRDYICGGAGKDKIRGNRGKDSINGQDGADKIWGGKGDDFILGAQGYDDLFGKAGADYIAGAIGNDMLVGGEGNDELQAGTGTDVCVGGPGNDDYGGCE